METTLILSHYLPTLSYWHWYGVAVVLLILEFLLMTSGFLLWLAIAAGAVGLLLWLFPLFAWPYQMLVFSLGGIVCSVVWWAFLLGHRSVKMGRRKGEQFKGKVFTLGAAIIAGKGTLSIGNSVWRVTGPDLPAGSKVRVVNVEKGSLQVRKLD